MNGLSLCEEQTVLIFEFANSDLDQVDQPANAEDTAGEQIDDMKPFNSKEFAGALFEGN